MHFKNKINVFTNFEIDPALFCKISETLNKIIKKNKPNNKWGISFDRFIEK